jgi:FkbM family methyltransferase
MNAIWNLLRFVWNHPMNRSGRVAAIVRVIRWQLGSRLLDGPIAIPFVNDTSLFATRGMTGATGNFYCGLHEVVEMSFVLHFLRPGNHFLDIGANVGSYTVLSSCTGARVTAVEPVPTTFASLERNVMLNGLSEQIRIRKIGLSAEKGTLRFSSDMDCVNHVLAPNEEVPSIDVPVLSLDELVGYDVPVLIKIDVEGHEKSVLLGGARTLNDARLQAVIMETNGSGERYGVMDDELFSAMKLHGFSAYGYQPFSRTLVSPTENMANTLFIRDRHLAESRVQNAPRFRLINGEI